MSTTSQIRIRPISETDFESFHSCLDAVSRERKYLGFVEAPPLEDTRNWLSRGREKGEIRLVAVDGPQIVGWCDIETNDGEGFAHSGRLGMGVLKEYRVQGLVPGFSKRHYQWRRGAVWSEWNSMYMLQTPQRSDFTKSSRFRSRDESTRQGNEMGTMTISSGWRYSSTSELNLTI